jgi:hypothetical protein
MRMTRNKVTTRRVGEAVAPPTSKARGRKSSSGDDREGPRTTLTADNLVALGAERLATMLLDIADADTGVKRRLRLELAAGAGGETIAAAIGKRLTALRAARSFVDWTKRQEFVRELETQSAMIVDRVAATRPDLALDLLWRFLAVAGPTLERADDSSGSVSGVFRRAVSDLGAIAPRSGADPERLADQVIETLLADQYDICDRLVPDILPALGEKGTTRLRDRLTERLSEQRGAKGRGENSRTEVVRAALLAISDHGGDIDGFIALIPIERRREPATAAAIGRRLLNAGRLGEAITALERATRPKRPIDRFDDFEDEEPETPDDWEEVYASALEAVGRHGEAQALRRTAFEERLSIERLREYLRGLPDFDDVEAEERAMEHASGFKDFSLALDFFRRWPNQAWAARHVLERSGEIDGNMFYLLDPTARLIEGRHPLAATLLRRAMITDTLERARSTRYKHAARHLRECAALAPAIEDFGTFGTHDEFIDALRAGHSRKSGFWGLLAEAPVRARRRS